MYCEQLLRSENNVCVTNPEKGVFVLGTLYIYCTVVCYTENIICLITQRRVYTHTRTHATNVHYINNCFCFRAVVLRESYLTIWPPPAIARVARPSLLILSFHPCKSSIRPPGHTAWGGMDSPVRHVSPIAASSHRHRYTRFCARAIISSRRRTRYY